MQDILNITALQQTIQKFVDDRDWEQFHNPKNLVAALTVEVSELLEIFQWLSPEQAENAKNDPVTKEKIGHELADIMIYLIQVADKTEVNLHAAITEKLKLAALKYPAERVRGQSKKYNEYAEWSA